MQTHEAPWNLLEQPLLPYVGRDGRRVDTTLPGALSALQANDVLSFPTLQDHQGHAFHAFLVQLAAIAIHQASSDTSPVDEGTWKRRLLALTAGDLDPWSLVVEDLSKPAFMQPPVPEGSLDKFGKWKGGTPFPDEIDILVTAKNHDVKARRIASPTPSHWVYALLNLQTMEGYSGRFNYGIARMNKGLSNRPSVSYATSLIPGDRFSRDVAVLLDERDELISVHGYPRQGGHDLVWLIPWDGTETLALLSCDPFFIEACRRLRLAEVGREVRAFGAPSQAPRLDGDAFCGRTGDPWTPIRETKKEPTSLTVSGTGFHYQLVQALLSNDGYTPGAALKLRSNDPSSLLFTATAMVRGQGETAGLHERIIPLTPRVRRLLGTSEGRERLGSEAKVRIADAAEVRLRALKPALLQLLQGAPDKLKMDDNRADPWLRKLDDEVDRIFFEDLWRSLEAEEPREEHAWLKRVFGIAEELLEEAFDSVPLYDARRYRSIAAAQRTFYGRRRNALGPSRKGAA